MKIENNVPVPRLERRVFPFGEMLVGQSFAVPDHKVVSCRNSAVGFGQRHGMKFCIRKSESEETRCWRVS
jgi:hypothetical protein